MQRLVAAPRPGQWKFSALTVESCPFLKKKRKRGVLCRKEKKRAKIGLF
jgi:hypothetical protein